MKRNIQIFHAHSEKYTTNQLEIKMYVPYSARRAMTLKLLAKYLENGSRQYRNRTEVERKLANLYGVTLAITVQRWGNYLEFSVMSSCVQERYIKQNCGGEQLSRQWLSFLEDILWNPSFEVGRQAIFDKEKTQLLNDIERDKDQPEVWNERLLYHLLMQTTHQKVLEMAQQLTMTDIQEVYTRLCAEADMYIVSHGNLEEEQLQKWRNAWREADNTCEIEGQQFSMQYIEHDFQQQIHYGVVQQAYIAIAYAVPKVITLKDRLLFFLANMMFGGSSTSFLFKNIREHKGLAYSVESHVDEMRHLVIVSAAVEQEVCHEVVEQVHAIWQHYGQLLNDSLFQNAKQMFLSETIEALDSPLVELDNVFIKEKWPLQAISITDYRHVLDTLTLVDLVEYVSNWKRVACSILQGEVTNE